MGSAEPFLADHYMFHMSTARYDSSRTDAK
uniref:Uncharacterized protein n=1 Tax=Arundo donax TaxID=35708 RepID=A0A0A8ZVX9_ARUDO